MRFNAAKCNIMRVSRTRDPKLFNYSLTIQELEEVMDPYQKYNSEKVEMVQRRAAKFVKSR